MHKLLMTLLAAAVLAGCTSAGTDAGAPEPTPTELTSTEPTSTDGSNGGAGTEPDQTPEPASEPSPSADPADLPSDVRTQTSDGSITYTFAAGELTLTLPHTWTDIVGSSKAFPIAVENPEGTQQIVVAEIGPSRLTPEPEPYRQLLIGQLGLADDAVAYIGWRYAGDTTYPAFEIRTDDYAAWVFLVTANDRQYELTVKSDTYADGTEALALIDTLTTTG